MFYPGISQSLAEPVLPLHCSLVLSTVTETRGFSALLWLRKMWGGEVAFPELKNMSPAFPSQVQGLYGYIPDPPPSAVEKALCQTLLLESCTGIGDRRAGGTWGCMLSPIQGAACLF